MITITGMEFTTDDGKKISCEIDAPVTLYHNDVLNLTITIQNDGEPRPLLVGISCPECKNNMLEDSKDYLCVSCRRRINDGT